MTDRNDLKAIAAEIVPKIMDDGIRYEFSGAELEEDYGLSRSGRGVVVAYIEEALRDLNLDWSYVPSRNKFILLPTEPEHPYRIEAHEWRVKRLAGMAKRYGVLIDAGVRRGVITKTSAEPARRTLKKFQKDVVDIPSGLKFKAAVRRKAA